MRHFSCRAGRRDVETPKTEMPAATSRSAAQGSGPARPRSGLLGVVHHPADVDDDYRLVAHYPAVVAWWQQRDLARPEFRHAAIVHDDVEPSRNMILEVGRLTTLGLGQGLDRSGPAP